MIESTRQRLDIAPVRERAWLGHALLLVAYVVALTGTDGRRDDSNFLSLTSFELGKRLSSEFIELSFCYIPLQLPIPNLPVMLEKPSSKCVEFFRREIFDLALQGFDFGHGCINRNLLTVIPPMERRTGRSMLHVTVKISAMVGAALIPFRNATVWP